MVAGPGAVELGAVESDAGAGARAVKVEKPALLEGTLPALLGDTLSTLFLGSLSPGEPMDLSDADLGAEQRGGFL